MFTDKINFIAIFFLLEAQIFYTKIALHFK